MSFFEGGRKTINQTTNVENRQAAIQGGGNFTLTGGQINVGSQGALVFESLDPLALQSMENVSRSAIDASQRYVEFASESNRLGLQTVGDVAETYANVARDVAGTGLTPEQISANRGTSPAEKINPMLPLLAIVGVGALVYFVYTRT